MNDLIQLPNSSELAEDTKATNASLPVIAIHSSKSQKLGKSEFAYTLPMINKIVLIENGVYNLVGSEVDAVYIAVRRKATQYEDGAFKSVLVDVNRGSDPATYNEWRSLGKDHEQGYKYGPEFLMYLPEIGKFCTFFTGTDLERSKASSIIMDSLAAKDINFTLFAYEHDGKRVKFPRTIIAARPCELNLQLPGEDETRAALEKFLNPPVWIEDPGDDR